MYTVVYGVVNGRKRPYTESVTIDLGCNFKKQITDLTVLDDYNGKEGIIDQTTNVFIKLLDFFENLNYLSCIGSFVSGNPVLSFIDLPSTTFVSSNLIKLCITVDNFGDCLCLLDGRLNQLSTFIVIIVDDKDNSSMEFNKVSYKDPILFVL
jgi:hypothetical protein